MRLIDADEISDNDICLALGVGNASSLPDIRELLDEQPTANPQCIATVKVDFSKEDIEKLVKEKVKEFIDINIGGLKDSLMEYFNIKKHATCRYGMMCRGNFYEMDENDVNDIIKFIRE